MLRAFLLAACLSGCASVQRAQAGAEVPLEGVARCLKEQDPAAEATTWEVFVGGDHRPAPDVERCLQAVVNAAGLEASRGDALRVVDIAWYPPGAPASASANELPGGGHFSVTSAWLTRPRKLSGPLPVFARDGDTGMAIVRCAMPVTGRPERCRVIKEVRGQDIISPLVQSTYTPCLKDGVAVECDYVQAFSFRRPSE